MSLISQISATGTIECCSIQVVVLWFEKNAHPNFIFRRFIEFLREVSHAEKRAPISDRWLH